MLMILFNQSVPDPLGKKNHSFPGRWQSEKFILAGGAEVGISGAGASIAALGLGGADLIDTPVLHVPALAIVADSDLATGHVLHHKILSWS